MDLVICAESGLYVNDLHATMVMRCICLLIMVSFGKSRVLVLVLVV